MAQHSDPQEIEREIERTRAELAETIDAIADKVSPKRAVARTADRVKTKVRGETRPRIEAGIPETGERVEFTATTVPGTGPATAADRYEEHARTTGIPVGIGGGRIYTVRRTLRVDRVLIVAGVATAVIVTVVVIRKRSGH